MNKINLNIMGKKCELNITNIDVLHIDLKHYKNRDIIIATAFDKDSKIIDVEEKII